MSDGLSYRELQRRVSDLEETLERFARKEQTDRKKLGRLESLTRIDSALRCSSEEPIVLWEVLGAVLGIFRCDRAWLLYPCDPGASTWRIRMERTTPGYPGLREQRGEMPVTPAIAADFRRLLESHGVVASGPEGGPLSEIARAYRVQSKLSMALRPRHGRPWQFGVHQCSYPRAWSPEEKELFLEAGHRIAAALNHLALPPPAEAEAPPLAGTAERRAGADDTLRLLRVQACLGEDLSAISELQPGLERCLAAALEASGMESGGIYVFEGGSKEARLACHRNLSPAFVDMVGRQPLTTPLGSRIVAGEALYLRGVDLVPPLGDSLKAEGILSVAVLPIRSEAQTVGCINVASRTETGFPESKRNALQLIAQMAGSAIGRIRFEEQLRHTHANLMALMEHTDDFVLISDREGRPVTWNRAYAAVIKELLGIEMKPGLQPHTLLKDPGAVAWWDGLHRRVLKGERFRVEYAHEQGAEKRFFEISYNPIFEKGEVAGFSELTRDITERRRAEQDLRESESRYRHLVSTIPLGVAEIDRDGTFLFSNGALDGMFAQGRGGMKGVNFASLWLDKREGAAFRRNLSRLADEQPRPVPWKAVCRRRDGEPVEIRVDWGYRCDAGGAVTGFSCIMTDVTERRKAQQALRESEEKFRSFAEESPNMILIFSGRTVIYVNRQCEICLGISRTEFYGGSFDFNELVFPKDRESVSLFFRRIAEGRDAPPLDCRLAAADGRLMHVMLTSRLISYCGGAAVFAIITDISQRREAEMALRSSEERYRRLIEESHEIIFTLDSEGRFVLLNPAFEEVLGWSVDEWLGKHFTELVPAEFHKPLEERFAALARGEKLPPNEIRTITRSGKQPLIEYSTTPIMKDGALEGVWGIARDVTLRRKAEVDRRSLVALRERERLSRWLHDHLGADLYNIVLLADSIQRTGRAGSVVGRQLEWITETSREALSSIRNYLDFSASAGGAFTELFSSINQYVASVLGPLNIEYRCESRGDLAAVTLTAVQAFNVYLIFKESLTNIIKHANASFVRVMVSYEKGSLAIVVEDNGTGIAHDEKPIGYGSMNLRARADELGAELGITPRPEGGTQVTLSLQVESRGE